MYNDQQRKKKMKTHQQIETNFTYFTVAEVAGKQNHK